MAIDFSNLTVLLVEDKPNIRTSMKWPLEGIGFTFLNILEAGNGIEALKILQEKEVDLIISDVGMDEMNGLELLEEIAKDENLKNIPFIFVTADISDDILNRPGVDEVIHKPINTEDFQERVKKVLEKRKGGGVDKDVCLQILDRALRVTYNRVPYRPIKEAIHNGPAKDWERFKEKDFQDFIKENNIQPEREIVIWEKESDVFIVTKKSEIT